MKKSCVMVLLLALYASGAHAATWIETSVEDWSFDAATVESLPNGLIRIWNRNKMRPEVVEGLERDLRASGFPYDYSQYSHSIQLWEMNCNKRLYRPILGTNYSSTGIQIASFDVEKARPLQRVTPDSDGEIVFDQICKFVRNKNSKKK